ncbi:hypothetical protein, partial [Streptomyces sp. NPDC054756]
MPEPDGITRNADPALPKTAYPVRTHEWTGVSAADNRLTAPAAAAHVPRMDARLLTVVEVEAT